MRAKRRFDATFNIEQENWIESQFHQGFSQTQVKRNFRMKYGNAKKFRKIQPHQFESVFKRFQQNGIARSSSVAPKKSTEDPKYVKIEKFYQENQKASLNEGSKRLKIPKTTIRRLLREKLGLKWFQDRYGQVLTKKHRKERLQICEWILTLPDELLLSIIFGDEKWFVLKKLANKKNIGTWSKKNPHVMKDFKSNKEVKIMVFCCVLYGHFLPLIWHYDKDTGLNISVNSELYLKLVKKNLSSIPDE